MVLIAIPNMKTYSIAKLLDLIPQNQVNYISAKICPYKLSVEPHHITPSIYLHSDEYRVNGLTTLEELKSLLLDGTVQVLKITLSLSTDNTEIKIDCLGHSITQRSNATSLRPLSMRLLDDNGLLGEAGIMKFEDIISTRY